MVDTMVAAPLLVFGAVPCKRVVRVQQRQMILLVSLVAASCKLTDPFFRSKLPPFQFGHGVLHPSFRQDKYVLV